MQMFCEKCRKIYKDKRQTFAKKCDAKLEHPLRVVLLRSMKECGVNSCNFFWRTDGALYRKKPQKSATHPNKLSTRKPLIF